MASHDSQPVTGFTLLAASGLDYRATAVPEPATWDLLLGGLALAGPFARRCGLDSSDQQ
jgi:hypothetical protein